MLLAPHRLADGTLALVRPIGPGDKPALRKAFGRLSPESARLRFLAPKPRLTAAELRYLTEVDGFDHIALVAVAEHDPGLILGVARCVRLAAEPDAAEVAIVVGDPWQGQRLGSHLGLVLADLARRNGVERFTASILSDNVAAHRLLAGISARLAAPPAAPRAA